VSGGLVVTLALVATSERVAHANGRFPDAQQLVVEPGNEQHLAVQTTYGFIETRDHGANWWWTCEAAAGYGGVLDPPIALLSGGTLIAGVFDGLVVQQADGCDLGFVGGELEGRFFVDVSVDKSNPTHAIAVSSDGLGMNKFDSRVWQSEDGAATWTGLGAALPDDILALTLDSAPSDPSRIYLTGFRIVTTNDYRGVVVRSVDGGATWETIEIPGSANDSGPYLAAVDPTDPDTLYIRLAGMGGQLLVSNDAGDTTTKIFSAKGAITGFALSPDGSTLRIGGVDDGILGASTTDYAFTPVNTLGARCLTFTSDALYVCGREAVDGFTIGESHDMGVTFEPIHHIQCLGGPDPACGPDTTITQECPGPWAAQRQILQTDTCPDATSGTGGGGQGGAGGGGETSDGCSCREGGGSERGGDRGALGIACALVGAVGALRRARRRRAS
jgi:hypothetical protein